MAQNITLMGASYSAVPAVTLPKTGGGTASFTDVTDTTATASDVASGKYFYTAAGVKTEGTGTGGGGGGSVTQDANGYIVLPSTGGGGGGGGSSVQKTTGTFIGSGTITQTISCSFAPDLILIHGDLTSDVSLRGVVYITIVKDTELLVVVDGSQSASSVSLYYEAYGITEYGSTSAPYASYSNGTLTLNMVENTSSLRFNSSVTYNYTLVKYSTDSESTWETLLDASNIHVNTGSPYGGMWIPDLGDVPITADSVWRITFDNDTYVVTATANGVYGSPNQNIIGNPLFMGGTDNGSDVPVCFEQNPWGAWTGGADTTITQDVDHYVKIERQVTS